MRHILSVLAQQFLDKCQMQANASGRKVHAYAIAPHTYKMILDGEDRPAGLHIGSRSPEPRHGTWQRIADAAPFTTYGPRYDTPALVQLSVSRVAVASFTAWVTDLDRNPIGTIIEWNGAKYQRVADDAVPLTSEHDSNGMA